MVVKRGAKEIEAPKQPKSVRKDRSANPVPKIPDATSASPTYDGTNGQQSTAIQTEDLDRDLRFLKAILDSVKTRTCDDASLEDRQAWSPASLASVVPPNLSSSQPRRSKSVIAKSHPRKQNNGSRTNSTETSISAAPESTSSLLVLPATKTTVTRSFNASLKFLAVESKKQKSSNTLATETGNGQSSISNNVLRHADCACLGLDVLHCIENNRHEGTDCPQYPYLEAASLLLDRLLVLNLTVLSHRLARCIHEQYWKRCKFVLASPKKPLPPLHDLFCIGIDQVPSEPKTTSSFCRFQSQILRLALLMGPASATSAFIRALLPQATGSPLRTMDLAVSNSRISSEESLDWRRSIVQTLSKLYALMVTSSDKSRDFDIRTFQLGTVVCLSRLALDTSSACILFEKAVRSLWRIHSVANDEIYHTIHSATQAVIEHPKIFNDGYHTFPIALVDILAQIAEANAQHSAAVLLLEHLVQRTSAEQQLLASIRLLAANLLRGETDSAIISSLVARLREPMACQQVASTQGLLAFVRLRKACVAMISNLSQDQQPNSCENLSPIVLQLLTSSLHLLTTYRHSLSSKDGNMSQPVIIAEVKTIDAVLSIDNIIGDRTSDASNEYMSALSVCHKSLQSIHDQTFSAILTQSLFAVVKSTTLKLANAFWHAHDHLGPNDAARMEFAEASVSCIRLLPSEQQQEVSLGPRLEKIAAFCSSSKKDSEAKDWLLQAVKHYIEVGGLAQAEETALAGQNCIAWTGTVPVSQRLGRALQSYIDLNLTTGNATIECFVDDEDLDGIQRATLMEHQLLYLLNKSHDLSIEAVLATASEIQSHVGRSDYQTWCMRFASNLVFRIMKRSSLEQAVCHSLLPLLEQSRVIPQEPSPTSKGREPAFWTYAISMQISLLGNRLASDFESAAGTYSSHLSQALPSHSPDQSRDTCELLNSVALAFVDLSMVLALYGDAIRCLRILCHLSTLTPKYYGKDTFTYRLKLAQCHRSQMAYDLALLSLDSAYTALLASQDNYQRHLSYHLLAAEIHLDLMNLESCKSSLKLAAYSFDNLTRHIENLKGQAQIKHDSFISRAALLYSRLARLEDRPAIAIKYARQATKISSSIWAALNKKQTAIHKNGISTINVPSDDELQTKISQLEIRDNTIGQSNAFGSLHEGALFWPYLHLHLDCLKEISSLTAHSGSAVDAMVYLEQIHNIEVRIRNEQPTLNFDGFLAVVRLKQQNRLGRTSQTRLDVYPSLQINLIGFIDELLFCAQERHLKKQHGAKPKKPNNSLPRDWVALADSLYLSNGSSQKTSQVVKSRHASTNTKQRRRETRKESHQTTLTARPTSPSKNTRSPLQQLLLDDRLRAIKTLSTPCDEEACGIDEARSRVLALAQHPKFLVAECFVLARMNLDAAWRVLRSDTLQSVLSDSAMALPYASQPGRAIRNVSLLQGTSDPGGSVNGAKQTGNVQEADKLQTAIQRLNLSEECCRILLDHRAQHCSVEMLHKTFEIHARVSLLLTTLNMPYVVSSTDLVLAASEPSNVAIVRDQHLAQAERQTSNRDDLSVWPNLSEVEMNPISVPEHTDVLTDLPALWTVVNIMMVDEQQELLISRITGGQTEPFLVRLPLRRADDGDRGDSLSYRDAKQELDAIIENANESSHDARSSSTKEARREWHADREQLDKDLELLLQNIETIWLGGFKGIFCPDVFTAAQIDKFAVTLQATLDRHLPSRRRASESLNQLQIHRNILEMFLGLIKMSADGLDDDLLDLLYFVVDILQMTGERNAYDEIDWDAMIAEVLDSLQVMQAQATSMPQRHTILIVDKRLESFPWESLPCLIDRPVSRMPSLAAVMDRVRHIKAQAVCEHAWSISKSSIKGSYILNPSGDLEATEATFAPILDKHVQSDSFAGYVRKPPSEDQFKDRLANDDLVIYFGHGSGAQYIRPRTIRSLERSAVTLLFGCSSAKMTEYGDYESAGMPRAYLTGNSQAVLGCLWDVTDREVDRFALRALSEWGLVDAKDPLVQQGLKKKGRSAKSRLSQRKATLTSSKTLMEAVRDGRDACVLKYICGAAVVVYGVPVVLSE